jgi:hypothetical protein
LENKGILAANNIIKYNPAKSIVKLTIGSEIKLTQADFARLSKAFFEEIETKFTSAANDAG